MLYYPYWVGGIYEFADTGSTSRYFITEEEAAELGNERFAYATYTKDQGDLVEGNFKSRQYDFAYFISKIPVKPEAVSNIQVTLEDGCSVVTWDAVTGARGYRIYVVYESGYTMLFDELVDTTYTVSNELMYELAEMGGSEFTLKICAYSDSDGVTIESDLSPEIPLNEEVVIAPTEKETTTAASEKVTTAVNNEPATTVKKPETPTNAPTVDKVVPAPAKAKIAKAPSKKKASKKVKVSFKKVSEAVGYEIQFSTTKKFKKVLVKKTVKKTTVTISNKKLKNQKKLFVRIRAYKLDGKEKVWGKWSKVKKVAVK